MVILQYMSNIIGNVLINENNSNIRPRCKRLKGLLDLLELGVLLDNEKVAVFGSSMANAGQQKASDSVFVTNNRYELADFL